MEQTSDLAVGKLKLQIGPYLLFQGFPFTFNLIHILWLCAFLFLYYFYFSL
jgi:hypothetical protein